jgi:hypothetical protein
MMLPMLKRRTVPYQLFALLFVLGLVGCNLQGSTAAETLIPPSPTSVTVLSTPVPTLARSIHTIEAPTEDVQPEIAATPEVTAELTCGLEASIPTIRHQIEANIDYGARTATVNQTVRYVNRGENDLNDIVLNVEANRYPDAFTLTQLAIKGVSGDATPEFDLTGRRMLVELLEPLRPNCVLELHVSFDITVPAVAEGVLSFRGFFGHSDRQLNLGHWLPTVALRAGDEWVTRQVVFLGEQEVLAASDWDVTLNVTDANDDLMVAAPGEVEELGDHSWRYQFTSARDFTVSMSEEFKLSTIDSESGVKLELYTLPDAMVTLPDGSQVDGAAHALSSAVLALDSYSDLFGPLDEKRLAIVQGDFPDGMEFSGIVFVSTDWFTRYTGDPASFLTLITVHEVAHQWWYAQVGNDPALAPWLDEALATYCEYIFLEEFYPNLKDWWWGFRVETYAPQGFVDSTVYEFGSIREYINAVYLRGVLMLHQLRQDIGTEAFFDWLKRYATGAKGEVATPNFLWSLLSPEQLAATEQTRAQFLRQPNVQ